MSVPQCKVCDGPHNVELHQSTMRIRAWLKERVTLAQKPAPAPVPVARTYTGGLANVSQLRSPQARKKGRK